MILKGTITALVFVFVVTELNQASEIPLAETDIAEQLFKKVLKRHRAEQLLAIKSFQKVQNYERQYQMITLMAEKVFTIIQESRALVEASPYIPGVSDFPLEGHIRDALSNIISNTALFAEILLRFPDITVSVLKMNNNWDVLLQWGIGYCHQINYLLDESTETVLNLTSQELNHVPRDPNYINPYRKVEKKFQDDEEEQRKVRKKKKKLKKGPRLHDEF